MTKIIEKKVLDHCVNTCKHRKYALKADGSNADEFYKADVLELIGKEFRNYGGYPRNEIAVINEQQSIEVAKALFERLQQLPDDSKLEKDVSDADLKLQLKSRYCQTPSEQIAHNEEMLRIRDERLQTNAARKAADSAIAREKAKKDALWNSLTEEERASIMAKRRQKELDSLV